MHRPNARLSIAVLAAAALVGTTLLAPAAADARSPRRHAQATTRPATPRHASAARTAPGAAHPFRN